MSETYTIPTLRKEAETSATPAAPPPLRRGMYNAAATKGELGMHFFHAGFKDMTRAAALQYAIWQLVPLGGVTTRETRDAFEVSFAFLRTLGTSTEDNPRLVKSRNGVAENTDRLIEFLFNKLDKLTTPFTVEVFHGLSDQLSQVKIVFIKNPILAMVDEKSGWVTRKSDDWSAVRKEIRGLGSELLEMKTGSAREADMAVASTVLMHHRARLDWVDLRGFWSYHRATLEVKTDDFTVSAVGKLVKFYPKEVYERYRFLTIHLPNNRSRLMVLRKTVLD